MVCIPLLIPQPHRERYYVKNKAGLTGQTVPGRRIPGHWPYPGPEELAETESCVPGLIDVPCFVFLFNTPPHERVLAKLGRHGRANFSMSRLRSASGEACAALTMEKMLSPVLLSGYLRGVIITVVGLDIARFAQDTDFVSEGETESRNVLQALRRWTQCSTFTGMRDLKESNNLHRRIKSGKLYHLYPIPLQVVQSN